MNNKTIEISIEDYNTLMDKQLKLIALEGAGVDNWDGYDEAMKSYEELKLLTKKK